MALTHEFGIIDDIQDKGYKNYVPEKYQCISLKDEIILNWISVSRDYDYSVNIATNIFRYYFI